MVALYIAAPYRRLLIKTSNKGVAVDIRAIRNEIEGKREEKGLPGTKIGQKIVARIKPGEQRLKEG